MCWNSSSYVKINTVPLLLKHSDRYWSIVTGHGLTVKNTICTWNETETVCGGTLTWARWWPQTGNPHSWCGCCQSLPCPSPCRTPSWTGAACTPEWSGPTACRDVHLGRRSAASASEKTGGSGCSPFEQELRMETDRHEWSRNCQRYSRAGWKLPCCSSAALMEPDWSRSYWWNSALHLCMKSHSVEKPNTSILPVLVLSNMSEEDDVLEKTFSLPTFSTTRLCILFKQRTNARQSSTLRSHALDCGSDALVGWNVQNKTNNIIWSLFLDV